MLIRATKKALNQAHIAPEQTPKEVNDFNEWYVTTARTAFKGKGLLLFVHQSSLLTVIIESKSIKRAFPIFKVRLNNLLKRSKFPAVLIDKMLGELQIIDAITGTKNKSTIAYLNSIVSQIENRCLMFETYDDLDFDVEENLLLESLYKKQEYFSPVSWWNNYILGEDPYQNFTKMRNQQQVIQASKVNKNGLTLDEELHMENQVLKMYLEQKFGKPINLNISGDGTAEIPLVVENEFLKQMSLFEKQMRDAKETTIYQLLGAPKFKPTSSLKGERLSIEIIRVLKLLFKHQITVDFLAEYEPELVYHFLTDELMEKKIPNMNIPGFVTHFIYEEFHPNHEHEVSVQLNALINDLFNPEVEEDALLAYTLGNDITLNNELIKPEVFLRAIKTFHLTKKSLLVIGFDVKDIILSKNDTHAKAIVDIILKNEIKGKRRIRLPLIIHYEKGLQWWKMKQLFFDDFVI